MATHGAQLIWERGGQAFVDARYSRRHRIRFDGGLEIDGSSSPHSVPLPYSDPAAMDPEEAFIASLSSCHMLWFLALAAKRGFVVDRYEDRAEGQLARDETGKTWMQTATLHPQVRFQPGKEPDPRTLAELHHEAHELCYIANSVRTQVTVAPLVDG